MYMYGDTKYYSNAIEQCQLLINIFIKQFQHAIYIRLLHRNDQIERGKSKKNNNPIHIRVKGTVLGYFITIPRHVTSYVSEEFK